MNLTIDIGNTCTKLVAFDGYQPLEEIRIDDDWSPLEKFCAKYNFTRGIYSSVVHLSEELQRRLDNLPFPMMELVSGKTPLPIVNKYKTPQTLGTDRLAAAVGAFYRQKGKDVLIIDVGTCITYDYVNSSGEYLGGNISPGPTIRLKALNVFTDSLPLVQRHGESPALGNTTETAIRSGVLKGIEYEINGYISDLSAKNKKLSVYITGGVCLDLNFQDDLCIYENKFIVPEGLNHILIYNSEL